MRILDDDRDKRLDNVTIFLTKDELLELIGCAQQLLENPIADHHHLSSRDYQKEIYTNNLKNREFGKEAPQIFCRIQVTVAERQGTSENEKYGVKPTRPKTDFSGYLCITVCIYDPERIENFNARVQKLIRNDE